MECCCAGSKGSDCPNYQHLCTFSSDSWNYEPALVTCRNSVKAKENWTFAWIIRASTFRRGQRNTILKEKWKALGNRSQDTREKLFHKLLITFSTSMQVFPPFSDISGTTKSLDSKCSNNWVWDGTPCSHVPSDFRSIHCEKRTKSPSPVHTDCEERTRSNWALHSIQ